MYKDLIQQRRKDFEASFERAKVEAAAIRTGRANSSMVEDLVVDYLGSKLRVKELGTISVPEPRQILIQPWDKGALQPIEKAIKGSSLGLNPAVDSQAVRLTIPQLTEERRREFIKLLHQKMEEARIRIRQIREEILKKVQQEVHAKTAREDDLRHAKEDLQKIMDDLHKRLDELTKKKEQELMN
ncbi:MAG: ribosome recycling factor [Candidatus Yanofskybacteria bacterium RIFCSPLOWO2_01_FULL_45_72]|nr:MAG: ribosome recycling factor [Candidatus Yanofskybacteria bacterium RIFCSPLOWO2_01_FULL_45_72]